MSIRFKSPLPLGDGHGWPSVAGDMDVERRQRARRRRGEGATVHHQASPIFKQMAYNMDIAILLNRIKDLGT